MFDFRDPTQSLFGFVKTAGKMSLVPTILMVMVAVVFKPRLQKCNGFLQRYFTPTSAIP
ncbi:hypothetical protein HanRHA438_Chr01g0006681 [Helianthus annuus]|nr:hypothetical protein HanRHA438_Chr01g0006681 [Helianthus annuus]